MRRVLQLFVLVVSVGVAVGTAQAQQQGPNLPDCSDGNLNCDGRIPQETNPDSECSAVALEEGLGSLEPFAKFGNPSDPDGGFDAELEGDGDDISFDPDPPAVPEGSWSSTVPIKAFLLKQATYIYYWLDPGTALSYIGPDDYSHFTFCISENYECDSPTLGEDDIDESSRTLSNTMQDDEGIDEFSFTTLDNFTVASIDPSSGFDQSGNTWTWTGSGTPPTTVDFTLAAGDGSTSTYFLEVTDACIDPNTVTFDPTYEMGLAVSEARIMGNTPNPFGGQTTVEFALPEEARVSVVVYDLMGRKVATLVEGTRSAGTHSVSWNGRSEGGQDLASGVYLLRLQAGDERVTRRMTIVR